MVRRGHPQAHHATGLAAAGAAHDGDQPVDGLPGILAGEFREFLPLSRPRRRGLGGPLHGPEDVGDLDVQPGEQGVEQRAWRGPGLAGRQEGQKVADDRPAGVPGEGHVVLSLIGDLPALGEREGKHLILEDLIERAGFRPITARDARQHGVIGGNAGRGRPIGREHELVGRKRRLIVQQPDHRVALDLDVPGPPRDDGLRQLARCAGHMEGERIPRRSGEPLQGVAVGGKEGGRGEPFGAQGRVDDGLLGPGRVFGDRDGVPKGREFPPRGDADMEAIVPIMDQGQGTGAGGVNASGSRCCRAAGPRC